MKLIHASGFDASERESFRLIVFSNIISAMKILLEAVDQLKIPLQDESLKVSYFLIIGIYNTT
jgi:guanine nucleotide-binding protein subunit alpha